MLVKFGSIEIESPWDAPTTEELVRLWETGLSANKIARCLGVSKNAVIGKVRRMKLPGRPSPIRNFEQYAVKARKARIEALQLATAEKELKKRLEMENTIREMEGDPARLPNGGCRFIPKEIDPRHRPEGMDIEDVYCRHPTLPDQDWCEHHFNIVYKKKPVKAAAE